MLRKYPSTIFWSCLTLVTLNDLVASLTLVKDDGLSPFIERGDIILVNKMTPKTVKTGDIVLIRNPEASRERRDLNLVRQVVVADAFSRHGKFRFMNILNETLSRDSKDFGSVPEALVLGKVTAILFPPWRMGAVQ